MSLLALPAYALFSDADEGALADLDKCGTPPNTLLTSERDLAYIAAWKMASCDDNHRGIRDRAMLMLAFASGGRRRSEITALNVEDIGRDAFKAQGLLWIRLLETKTRKKDQGPRLPMTGRAARALVHWLEVSKITNGPLFRPISLSDRPLPRR